MSTDRLLQVLESQVESLAKEIGSLATASNNQQPRFDQALFSSHGTRLQDYLLEVRKNLAQLNQSVAENRLQQVAFLAEKLVAQIFALQRELATQTLRKNNPSPQAAHQDPYHKLAEHQVYEQRLIAMIQDKESQLGQCVSLSEQQQTQKALATLEGRLARCRQALRRIEKSIERKEHDF